MSNEGNNMPTIDKLVFICCNQKAVGKCCASSASEKIYEYCRQEINIKRHLINPDKRVQVVKTGCLGQCATGPNIIIFPDNIWYNFSDTADIDEIIDSHLINGIIVSRLLKTPLST